MELNLQRKTAIVTGGAKGIGRSIALLLGKEGASVVIADIASESSKLTLEEIEAIGGKAVCVVADVRLRSDADLIVKTAVETFGHLDILVNNAGLTRIAPLLETTEENWDLVVETNLKGTFLCSQAAARIMIPQGHGCIVNISSMCAIQGWAEREAYGSAKAGVNNLTRILAAELGCYGIRVNSIAPGYVLTEQLQELIDSGKIDEKIIVKGVPLGSLAEPDDIADAVAFLASSRARYITGEVLVVDGGWTSSGGSWQIFPSKARKKTSR